ncbi:gas vesicle protein [Prolixibacteraceae bacterium JC049]|nr:gas vesicle protein [Prolixibacteraceae bacterium JC049]
MEYNIIDESKEVTLLEVLDRVLNKGVVVSGELIISVADIDLVYVGVNLLVSSVETMEQLKNNPQNRKVP